MSKKIPITVGPWSMEEVLEAQIIVRDEQIAKLKKELKESEELRHKTHVDYTGVNQNFRIEFDEGSIDIIWNAEMYDIWSILEAHFDDIEKRREYNYHQYRLDAEGDE